VATTHAFTGLVVIRSDFSGPEATVLVGVPWDFVVGAIDSGIELANTMLVGADGVVVA
jgi:hypothetical protein